MELHHLRSFVAVAELQSVAQAAEQLHTTPPSVSAHIKALEQELAVALFVRTPRGMALTRAGEALRRRAEQALRAVDAVLAEAASFQDEIHSELTIGTNATPSFLKLPQLLGEVRRRHPRLGLSFQSSVTGHIVKQLSNRTLDAGFLFGETIPDGLAGTRLSEVSLVVAAPADWAPTLRDASWESVAALPWIASTPHCPFEAISDGHFARHGRTPPKVGLADDGATKLDLVRAGLGAAVMERSEAEAAAAHGGIAMWMPDGLASALHFAWPVSRAHDPALTAVRSIVARLWSPPAA